MLTRFSLNNFKTWKETGSIRLAPITVFFGTNSSGKSSLGQFLLMLRRTVEQTDRNLVFHTTDDRNPVDLGSYFAYVHNHDEKRDVNVAIEWKPAKPVRLTNPLRKRPIDAETLGFNATVGLAGGRGERVICKALRYRLNPTPDDERVSIEMVRKGPTDKYQLTTCGFDAVRNPGRAWPLPAPGKFYAFPDELYAYYQNVGDFAALQLELERILKNLHYLGPLRQYPRREYNWTGQTPGDVGFQGENTIAALLAGAERKFQPRGKRNYEPLMVVVAGWLKRLGIVESFRLEQVSKLTRSYQVRLKMPGRSTEVTLPDVGFGVSQVLPVITAAFCAPAGATVIIEQPELHLHPKVQADLADLLIEAIHCKEGAAERGVQFLIESHSEHFLRRLQRRIAEETLDADQFAAYVCKPGTSESGSTIEPLRVDEYGNILNWPPNFFGDQMTEIAEMRKAGLKRRVAGQIEATARPEPLP